MAKAGDKNNTRDQTNDILTQLGHPGRRPTLTDDGRKRVRSHAKRRTTMQSNSLLTRRSALMLATGIAAIVVVGCKPAEGQVITVHKHPNCGCCSGWVRHLQ